MANLITGIRVLATISLRFCPTFSIWFYAMYIVGGISDVLDGIVARHFGKATEFGARLDTIADIIFTVVVLAKVIPTVNIPLWLIVWIACIAVIKCYNIISGLIICKRFVAEHTTMNKICGVLLFLIPLLISSLPRKAVVILIILTCAVATFAAIQEGYYICNKKEVS